MKTKLQFSDIKGMLSRDEMKKVVGGYGTCGVRIGNQAWCGMSSWQAQSIAAQNGAYWCCNSCARNGGGASYC